MKQKLLRESNEGLSVTKMPNVNDLHGVYPSIRVVESGSSGRQREKKTTFESKLRQEMYYESVFAV